MSKAILLAGQMGDGEPMANGRREDFKSQIADFKGASGEGAFKPKFVDLKPGGGWAAVGIGRISPPVQTMLARPRQPRWFLPSLSAMSWRRVRPNWRVMVSAMAVPKRFLGIANQPRWLEKLT